ncbi:SgcJ/EcaC family oxidoreductase [Halobellus sp. Atlit-31R]|nr:SgcJ/EcaC family oxidoreductase [Halobellus sp. Atlit-31R]
MPAHPLEQLIPAADAAIMAEDYDTLMDFYADDATLVVTPGLYVTGKENIRKAFVALAEHVAHTLVVTQGRMQVIEGAGTGLVIMESRLAYSAGGEPVEVTRRATYVFRQEGDGRWVCTVDNSYGTELLAD